MAKGALIAVANMTMRDKDPTMTLTLRAKFVAQMNKRFRALKGAINKSIIDNDCFAIKKTVANVALTPLGAKTFQYTKDPEKIKGFMTWLKGEEEKGILEISMVPSMMGPTGVPWTNVYIQSAYQKGIAQARIDMKQGGAPIDTYTDQTLNMAFYQPFHADRVALIYTRAYNELKGVTEAMNQQISRELALGMARGDGPYRIAQLLNDRVDKIGIVRARLIARTETVHALNEAALNEYELLENMVGETVKVKWWTALDERVRSQHAAWHGKVMTRKVGRARIGAPNCRCALRPWLDSWDEEEQELAGITGPKPMSSIGRFGKCLVSRIANIFNRKTAVKPQACRDYVRDKKGNWYLNGEKVKGDAFDRLKKMRIPPAWKNVVVAVDTSMDIQAIGRDAAGRWQYRYSAEHVAKKAREKFDRLKSFTRNMPSMRRKIADDMAAGDDRAMLLHLEDKTAIRAGSKTDFKAKKKAYGLTTLKSRHVSVSGDKITLDFTAKEGIAAHYELEDDVLAEWLTERKASVGIDDDLFPDLSAQKMNKYIKELSNGEKFTLKDFRTYHGTRIAYDEIKQYAGMELDTKKKKEILQEVSKKASDFLHNTPTMARNSYIDPMVWEFIGGIR